MGLQLRGTTDRLVTLTFQDFEGGDCPRPQGESRLSLLLALVPLAVGIVIEDEDKQQRPDGTSGGGEEKERRQGTRRTAFATSLQVLGQMETLLYPPSTAAAAANRAAAAVAAFVSSVTSGSTNRDGLVDMSSIKPGGKFFSACRKSLNLRGVRKRWLALIVAGGLLVVGNLRHLIVESSIARGLLDTSAYFWPGMTGSVSNAATLPSAIPTSPWTSFMEGAAFSASLRSLLLTSPAGRSGLLLACKDE